jgi:hypothetical protein
MNCINDHITNTLAGFANLSGFSLQIMVKDHFIPSLPGREQAVDVHVDQVCEHFFSGSLIHFSLSAAETGK